MIYRASKKRIMSIVLVFAMTIGAFTGFSYISAGEEQVTILYEEESKRTENEKHYLCSDGSYIALSYPGAVHYKAEDGSYQEIENALVYDEKTGTYQNPGNPEFSVSFATTKDIDAVSVKAKELEEISFSTALLINGNGNSPKPQKKNIKAFNNKAKNAAGKNAKNPAAFDLPQVSSSLEYAKYYGDQPVVTGKYTLGGNALKEDIILTVPTDVTGFVTTYKVKNVTLTVDPDGSLLFKTADGKDAYTVNAPYMYDAEGSRCPSIAVSAVQKGNKFEVTYLPDGAWLTSAERVYPLTFDPTLTSTQNLVLDYNTVYNAYYEYSTLQNNEEPRAYVGGESLFVAWDTLPNWRNTAYIGFSSVGNFNLKRYEIIDATLQLKTRYNYSSQPALYRLDSEHYASGYWGIQNVNAYEPAAQDFISQGVFANGYCTFDLMTETSVSAVAGTNAVQDMILYKAGMQCPGFVIYETNRYGSSSFYSAGTVSVSNVPQLIFRYQMRMPKGTAFTMQNESSLLYLNTSGESVTLSSTRPDYANALELVEHVSGNYNYYGIRIVGSNRYLSFNTSTGAVSVVTVAEGTTPSYNCLWALGINDSGNYSFSASTGSWYLCEVNGALQVASSASSAQKYWIFKDHLSLDANPEDNVEFVFYNKMLDLCIEYPNVYSATAEITLATFNPVIHETESVSGAYTATTRPVCQRFTFKAVRDANDEILYHLILPYLKLSGDVEGFYRENYHLTLKTNGEIGICTTCATGNPADECRWTLSGAITGMTVTNCGEAVNLGVDLDEGHVASVTEYDTDAWHVTPICLNVETEYQRTHTTCGAASGAMVVNYFVNETRTEDQFMQRLAQVGYSTSQSVKGIYKALNWEIDNTKESYNSVIQLYTHNEYTSDVPAMSSVDWRAFLSVSITEGCPVITNMISNTTDTAEIWGYESQSGHYVVITGIYWNSKLNCYEYVVNDPHYKFSSIGGRNLVIEEQGLYQVYLARNHTMVFPSTLYDMVVSD